PSLSLLLLHSPTPPTSTLFPYTTLFRSVLSFHTQPITIEDITRDFYHKELDILATRATGPGNSYRSPYVRWTSGENSRLVERFIDRKSTRLNSSHRTISYAVFCLKKKKT